MSTSSESQEWRFYVGLGVGCLFGVLLMVWLGRDGFYHNNLLVIVAVGVLLAMLMMASLLVIPRLLLELYQGKPLNQSIRWLSLVLVVGLTMLLGNVGANWLLGRQINAGKAWVEAAEIEIEAFYGETGRYPTGFEDFPETLPPMPRYLRRFGEYRSLNPGHWEIFLVDPRVGEVNVWRYSSRDREWRVVSVLEMREERQGSD
jgi:hypothetical protein